MTGIHPCNSVIYLFGNIPDSLLKSFLRSRLFKLVSQLTFLFVAIDLSKNRNETTNYDSLFKTVVYVVTTRNGHPPLTPCGILRCRGGINISTLRISPPSIFADDHTGRPSLTRPGAVLWAVRGGRACHPCRWAQDGHKGSFVHTPLTHIHSQFRYIPRPTVDGHEHLHVDRKSSFHCGTSSRRTAGNESGAV